ncbi:MULTISPECIES: hypothetical protein [Haloferax]|uniref:Uncharacterized protein n=2 Tax=Haloferax TaxID=2251 RepID=A0A6G1Z0P6_9EURY|nr:MULTISPECIES: hypothetical protein [Haloferax]KAB1187507.1 hypothetical protein Hfx1149_05465 [Haloferax sp. CBA1149]MRW80159.1 hypothetical protein [Haloferax marinisediminis]
MKISQEDLHGVLMIFGILMPGAFIFIFVGNLAGAFPEFELSVSFLRGYLIAVTLFCTVLSLLWIGINHSSSKYIN